MKLSHNTLINIGGSILPLAATLVTIPLYLHLIGVARFGALSIVWLLLGYFALFDFGLGRAASRYIAELHEAGGLERETLFWTVLAIAALIGAVGGGILWAAGRFLFSLFKMPEALRPEVVGTIPLLGVAVVVVTLTSVFVGALEGCERFLAVNTLQVISDWAFRLVPLAVAFMHGPDLRWIVGASIAVRGVMLVPIFIACCRYVPLSHSPTVDSRFVRKLCAFGGWITLSRTVNPILMTLDRFLIGVVRGASALTYYAVSFKFASKLLILPLGLSRTLFPRFSMQDGSSARELARSAMLSIAVIMTPVTAVAVLLLRPFFHLWLGPQVADMSVRVGEILLLGSWIDGLLQVPSVYLQGRGRPDLAPKFQLLEVAPFVGLLWIALRVGGPEGAACAFCVRLAVHFFLLCAAARFGWRMAATLIPPALILAVCAAGLWLSSETMLMRLVLSAFALAAATVWGAIAAPAPLRALLSVQRFRPLLASLGRLQGAFR